MFLESRADNTTVIKAPYPVPATGKFDGDDGSWSTFSINIGDDSSGAGQNFRVLISTSSPATIVPQQDTWCSTPDCATARGVEPFQSRQPLGFESGKVKEWNEQGQFSIPLALNIPWSPDANPNGTYGQASVGLGPTSKQSPILLDQYVIETKSQDYFMGSFGLAKLPLDTGGAPVAPFLTNYEDGGNIPSVSYGYTAGAYYQNNGKGTVGSLTLGGYDQSRFTDQNTTIAMTSDTNNTLIVGVQSIIYHPDSSTGDTDTSFTAQSSGFLATIDSTLPYLWLPDDICAHFQDKFRLTYDSKRNVYTVNDTSHTFNVNQKSTVSFKIGAGADNSINATTITLPYAAFDLTAGPPLFNQTGRYFPIKKSAGINVLGRAFLQEAYLIVDYERSLFKIAPANWSQPMPEAHLVPIYKKDYVPPPTTSTTPNPNPSSGGKGISGGAIAGIVVGIIAAFSFAALGWFLWRRHQKKKQYLTDKLPPPSEIDTTLAGTEVKHRRVSELDSEPPSSRKTSMGGYYDKDQKDIIPFPPINEMESPPAELYSPPPLDSGFASTPGNNEGTDYFTVGGKVRRRGATRESSGNNTPGTPAVAVAELPGDDGLFQVGGQHFEPVQSPTISPVHSRGPSDTSLGTNIDEVLAPTPPNPSRSPSRAPAPITEDEETDKEGEKGIQGEGNNQSVEGEKGDEVGEELHRRPSHTRGLSDTPTESTAVSRPTEEEQERWAAGSPVPVDRPLSPLN